jgi:hypothetical protein
MTATKTAGDPDAGVPPVYVQKAKIILLSTVAAMGYGVVHDQITARLCVEYFTIAHPPLFHTTSPTLLGICWGIAATFGVGIVLGVVLALVSQSEGPPSTPIPRVVRLIVCLLAVMAICASLAGLFGVELSRRSIVGFPAFLPAAIPASQHDRFMAVWFAHGASYLVGITGGLLVIVRIWLERGRPRVLTLYPRSRGEIIRALIVAAIAALILWFRFGRS